MWSLKAKEKYRGILRGESSGCKGITSSIFFNGDISCTIGLSSNMLKENQIKDLHLYLNMICDIINLVFNTMEETFQSNTLDWSSLVIFIIKVSDFSRKPFCFRSVFYYYYYYFTFFLLQLHRPVISSSILYGFTSNFQDIIILTRQCTVWILRRIPQGVGTGRGPKV